MNKLKIIEDENDEDEEEEPNLKITETISLNEISEVVLSCLYRKYRNKATEILTKYLEMVFNIYSIKDDKKTEMWVYQNRGPLQGIYTPNAQSSIKEICRQILGKAYSSQIVNAVIARIEADTFIEKNDFFKNDYIYEVPVINGILNIQTRKLSKFTPDKIFFSKLPVSFIPGAKCPKIQKFLNDVLRDKSDVLVIEELVGFSLLGEYRIERAFMFNGTGRNGKGKLILLFKRFVGPENCASIPIHSLKHESFAISELFGKRFNLGGDLSSKDFKETAAFKGLTGRDPFNAKRKFLPDILIQNNAKMVFACNELPRVYDFSPGFWERWILLDFPYKFIPKVQYEKTPKEERSFLKIMDTQIIDKITTPMELSGFLNAALDGLDRLLKQGDFSYTKGSSAVKDEWIRKSDSFTAFATDCLVDNPEGIIIKSDLRKAYHKYCKYHKVLKGSSDANIKIILQELFGCSEQRMTINDRQEHVWEGIRFNPDCHICHTFSTYSKNSLFDIAKISMASMANKKNNNIIKCFYCGEPVDMNEAERFRINNDYFHEQCFKKFQEAQG